MFTLCIPTYNRSDLVLETFQHVMNDSRIDEIIINDDYSKLEVWKDLQSKLASINNSKIKFFRNESNLGAFLNKKKTIELCKNDWIILLDSDNILTQSYLDSIPEKLDEDVFYLPSRAICESPNLDYTTFSGLIIDKEMFIRFVSTYNVSTECLLNTGNYLINKKTYLRAIHLESVLIESYALDVFYIIFLCFKNISDFKLKVVEGMVYHHRLHEGSHYLQFSVQSEMVKKQLISEINF